MRNETTGDFTSHHVILPEITGTLYGRDILFHNWYTSTDGHEWTRVQCESEESLFEQYPKLARAFDECSRTI